MKTIYWGIVLSELSKTILRSKYHRHPNLYTEHLTLAYDPSDFQEAKYSKVIGKEVELVGIGYASDDRCEALVVRGAETQNEVPHITLSCANDVRPIYSNTLLARGWEEIDPIVLRGMVGRYTRRGWLYE